MISAPLPDLFEPALRDLHRLLKIYRRRLGPYPDQYGMGLISGLQVAVDHLERLKDRREALLAEPLPPGAKGSVE